MTSEENTISYLKHKLKLYDLHFVSNTINDKLCILDYLLKVLLQEKGPELLIKKLNVAEFIQLESHHLLPTVADVELAFATFKNVFNGDVHTTPILLQGQCLVSMTTILLQAFGKERNGDTLNELLYRHIDFLLSLMAQTNITNNVYVRSVAASCLTEIELQYPCILKSCLDNIYTLSVMETSVAHQQYMCLMSLIIKHSLVDRMLLASLLVQHPQYKIKCSYFQEVNTSDITLMDFNQMVSFLMDQVPICTTEGMSWISMQIIEIMMMRSDLQSSVQVLKPLLLHYAFTYSAQAYHVIFLIEKHLGKLLFEEKDFKQYLRQLLAKLSQPAFPASLRLLFLDWTCNYLTSYPEKIAKLSDAYMLLPASFDGPESQLKKLHVLCSVLKNRRGFLPLLLQSLTNLVKQMKYDTSLKVKSTFIKVLYEYVCNHADSVVETNLSQLVLAVMMEDLTFSPFALNLVSSFQKQYPTSTIPSHLLTSLVSAFTLSHNSIPLTKLPFVLNIFSASISCGTNRSEPKDILTYLLKHVVCKEVCTTVTWLLGHQILSLYYDLMRKFDTSDIFYELCSGLKAFSSYSKDLDLQDRANMYHTLLVCLSNKKLKEALKMQKQQLTNIMACEDTYQSNTTIQRLKDSIFKLVKIKPKPIIDDKQVKKENINFSGNVLLLYNQHINSSLSQKGFVMKCELDIVKEFDASLLPIQGLAIIFDVPEYWGKINPIMVGHFDKTNPERFEDKSQVFEVQCFPFKPFPVKVEARAEFGVQNQNHVCSLETFNIELDDLFQPFSIYDELQICPHYWRQEVFINLWQSLVEKFETGSNMAFFSIHVLHLSREIAKVKLEKNLKKFIVYNSEEDNFVHVGIYLPPANHLLMKLALKEEHTVLSMAADNIHILAHVNDYFNHW